MHQDEFKKVFESMVGEMERTLVSKGAEYAGTADRLSNFKRGAAATGCNPLTVAFVYASKHFDSIATYVRNQQAGMKVQTLSEPIEGRFIDLMNYLVLMNAIVQEANNYTNQPAPEVIGAWRGNQ